MQDLDLDDITNDQQDAPDRDDSLDMEIFDKSYKRIQDSMKHVIQEILVTLEDGTTHIVYLMDIKFKNGQIILDINTPSLDRKEEIYVHAEKCVMMQINELNKQTKRSIFRW